MELIQKIQKLFTENFAKNIAELNKNVYIAVKNEEGLYEAPSIVIGAGGGTVLTGEPDQKMVNPALVSVEMKTAKPFEILYRLALPRSECEIAVNKPEYFKFLFKKILEASLSNYQATVGSPDELRFGSHYVKVDFGLIQDGSDFIEMQISGSWAGKSVD